MTDEQEEKVIKNLLRCHTVFTGLVNCTALSSSNLPLFGYVLRAYERNIETIQMLRPAWQINKDGTIDKNPY